MTVNITFNQNEASVAGKLSALIQKAIPDTKQTVTTETRAGTSTRSIKFQCRAEDVHADRAASVELVPGRKMQIR